MKRRIPLLFNLVFFIPAIILSIMVWRDYTDQLDANLNRELTSERELFFLDRGNKVLGIARDDDSGLKGELYDVKTEKLIKEMPLYSNIHSQIVSAYQNGRLILVTNNAEDRLQMNMIDSEGGVQELAQGKLEFSGFVDNNVFSWRGKVIVMGTEGDKTPYIAEINQGKLQKVELNNNQLLPSRPTYMRLVQGSFESSAAIPMFEVDLHDDRTAYVSGVLNDQGLPLTYIKKDEESSFDAEDRAAYQFAKQYNRDQTSLLKVNSEYPEQVRYYDASAKKWGAVLPTPMPVYQAKLYLLNDEETLIAGSNTKDEAEGHVLGYLYNEKTKEFTDVSAIVSMLTYDNLNDRKLHFYKDVGDDLLYYSNSTASAGWMNVREGAFGLLNPEKVQQWQINREEYQKSLQTFMDYFKQGDGLIINWVIWIIIPLILFGALAILPPILQAKHRRGIEQGITLTGTITQMSETGTYINNQPQIRFMVRFQDEGQSKEIAIKKVISHIDRIQVGDQILISYNRSKNKAMILNAADAAEGVKPKTIEEAVLTKIDFIGKAQRGSALMLHFEAAGHVYSIPVVQAVGFEYRIGERATLIQIGEHIRLLEYGSLLTRARSTAERLTLQGEITRVQPFGVTVQDRQLMVLEVLISHGQERIRKVNSEFVPRGLKVQAGSIIQVSRRKEELDREVRLLQGRQGGGKVTSVKFAGTTGDRPIARITVQRGDDEYLIEQSIEPVYGVEVGDELWIAYDEHTREAVIVNYAVN
ncbi:hypothetical protein [Paenibacillus motobuensis]|uniref:Uncharacterized protein n=1 Tax=Paenibacillus motobuensis TaxID=295324 RepID=A0ABN0Y828_9BACL